MGGYTGLDSSRSDRDQNETRQQPHDGISLNTHECEGRMPEAVNHREPDDCSILAKKGVRNDSADNGSEIDRRIEQMNFLRCRGLRHSLTGSIVHEPQVFRHEDCQNGLHSVEAESLGCFVADNVGDARRHSVQIGVRGSARF